MVLLAHRADTSVVLPISHCLMERVLHGLHSHGDLLKESYSAELVGCRSTSNVCRPGFVECNAVFAGADSRFVRFAWCSSGNARETSCVRYRLRVCTIICWQLGAQQRCKTRDLPSMESLKKTGCVRAPTGLQLADMHPTQFEIWVVYAHQ